MKRVLVLSVLVSLIFFTGCISTIKGAREDIRYIRETLTELRDDSKKRHDEIMATLQKNHQETMAAVNDLNQVVENSRRATEEEYTEMSNRINQGILAGVKVTGQMYPRATIYVREGPSKRYRSVGVLRGGEIVNIGMIERRWVRIQGGKWDNRWCTMLYMQLRVEPITQPE